MASAKSRRYGQGGSKHKNTPNQDRPNGKAWKKHPRAFDRIKGALVPAGDSTKGVATPARILDKKLRTLLFG